MKNKQFSWKTILLIVLALLLVDAFEHTDQIVSGYQRAVHEAR